jgi:hypothetical protein
MTSVTFNEFWADGNQESLARLLGQIKTQIDEDCRASDDPSDETPGISVTISINEDCDTWSYQTGDNNYSGGCYGHPYWGVGAVYEDSDCQQIVSELIDDLAAQIEFSE